MIRLLLALVLAILALHAWWTIMASAWRRDFGGHLWTDLRYYRRRLDRGASLDDIAADLDVRREVQEFERTFDDRAAHPSGRRREGQ